MSDLVKVCIDTPGPTITVEAHGELDTITQKALALYRDVVRDWPRPADRMGSGTGFHTERTWG